MPYSVQSKKTGDTYYLYKKDVTLRGGRTQTIYFFSKDANNDRGEGLDDLPGGYEVMENAKTGLPMLKRMAK